MNPFLWIVVSTALMSMLAWIGLILFAFREKVLRKYIPLLVAFAAGTLIGGSFFHLLPESLERTVLLETIFFWFLIGFTLFYSLELFLNWHHSHNIEQPQTEPVAYLVLLADCIHNFTGGIAIGASFLVSIKTGIITWIAAAAHEIPQELGDFGILVHSGMNKTKALMLNFLSALTVLVGGVIAYALTNTININLLLPFAAGNFTYIAASDLIPEIKHSDSILSSFAHLSLFISGVLLIYATRFLG